MNAPKCPKDQRENSDNSGFSQPYKESLSLPPMSETIRRAANEIISHLAKRLKCPLSGLLKVVENQVKRGQMSRYVLYVLVERVKEQLKRKEKHGEWNMEIRQDLESAESLLRGEFER